MLRVCAAVVSASALAGCVNYGALVTHGYINFAPATGPGYSYEVTFKNVTDFGYDGDSKQDRISAVATLLADKCPHPLFVDESVIETGKLPLGRPVRTYRAKVSCG